MKIHFPIVGFFLFIHFSSFGQFTIIPDPLGNQKAADTRIINSIGLTKEGVLLVATNWNDASSRNVTPSTGFYTYSEGRWSAKKLDQRGNTFEEYYNLTIAPDGQKIALNSQAVTGSVFRKITLLENLAQSQLKEVPINLQQIGLYSHIAFDSNSNLWCSIEAGRMIENKGNIVLSRYSNNEWQYFTTMNSFNMSHFIFGKNDQIITNNGSNYLKEFNENKSANQQKTITNKLKYNSKNVFYHDGAIWYENEYDKSIIRIADDVETKYTLPGEVDNINCIVVTNNGNLVVGSTNGLMILKNGIWKTYNAENSNLPSNNITSLMEDTNGKIWIAGNKKKWQYSEENIGSFICSLMPD